MSTGKHSSKKIKTNKFKFSNLVRILLIILIIFIISIAIYYFTTYIQPSFADTENTTNTEPVYETSDIVNTKKSLVVKGADFLEIVGVYINSDNPKLSTVSTRIKNTSNEVHENIELRITLLDKNDNTITTLDCKIDKLEANEETITYGALMQDLSDCVNYFVAIRKK